MAQLLSSLKKGERFDGVLLVKQAEVRVAQNGSRFLDVTLSDRSGEINAKAWDWQKADAPASLSVAEIKGIANEFMGKIQLKIDSILPTEVSKANLAALIPCAPEGPDSYLAQIFAAIDGMGDDDIKLLCAAVVDQNREKLRYWPAAASFHHSERSGLAHHTATMLKAAQALLGVYDFLDADLLLGGVIIHDICKIEELDSSELGLASEYTKKGLLLGHISMGVAYITGLAKELGVDDEIALLMAHMVLSHHSEPEYGSPRRPMFAEAEMLHYLDTMDARMYDMSHAVAAIEKGSFTGYIRSLENRKLYRHSKFHTGGDGE